MKRQASRLIKAFDAATGTLYSAASVFLAVAAMGPAFSPRTIAQTVPAARTQPSQNSDWETVAGGHMEFDVISIHPEKNPDADSSANVPFGGDDTYTDTGGLFRTTNSPVVSRISFAYKINTAQWDAFRASLPERALNQGFNIEARADNQHVTKTRYG